MRRGWTRGLLLLLVLPLVDLPSLRGEEPAKAGTPDTISAPLDRSLAGKGSLDDVIVDVVWATSESHLASCKCWGNGVGLWDRSTQFHLSKSETLEVVKAVKTARFGSLDDSLPEEGDSEGRIRVHVGTAFRTVWQMKDKEPGARDLAKLATTVLGLCEKAKEHGVTMANTQDGLEKLAKGTLSPEALEVVFKRKTDHPAAGVEPEDWLVQINGKQVLDRVATKDKSNPRRELSAVLSEKEYRELLALLVAANVPKLPESLYATQYSNLRVVVLNKTRNIQARQFAEMSPTQHGQDQVVFERVFDWGVALHKRALKDGKRVVRPVAVSPEHRDEKEKEEEREREEEKQRAKEKSGATGAKPANEKD